MAKVSIIIPTFNSEQYLRECLDSVINQTLRDIEIIIVDSVSHDKTLSIVEEYMAKDSRIKLIRREKEYVSASRNAGINFATAEYIMFLDSDDWYELNACEIAYNTIVESNSDVGTFSYNDYENENIKPSYVTQKVIKCYNKEIQQDVFTFIAIWHRIFKKSFLINNKIYFDPNLITAEDVVFSGLIFLHNPVNVYITESLVNYRKNRPGSATTKQINGVKFDLIALKSFLNNPLVAKQDDTFKLSVIQQWCEGILFFYNKFSNIIEQNKVRKDILQTIKFLDKTFDKKLLQQSTSYRKVQNICKLFLLRFIFSITNSEHKTHKEITIFGIKLKLKSKKLLLKKIEQLEEQYKITKNKFDFALNKLTPQNRLKYLEYHIAEHCNLNCKNCDHFSPLAEPNFPKIKDFERDIKRLAQISNKELDTLKLLGGEPLLNPEIIDFMRIARENLPNTNIQIVTNGILLNEQKEYFWHACKKYNVIISVTKYPLNLDFDKIKNTAHKHDVEFEFYGGTDNVVKTSHHIPLDLSGKQNIGKNFITCYHSNLYTMLKNGKIYPCTVAPNIEHFNKFFGYQIPLTDSDGIDIHKATTMAEVLEFIAKPIPFCKYCNVKCRTFGHEWGISKKEIEEWSIN